MDIQFKVTGGTVKNTRFKVFINGLDCGELTVERPDFTRICDQMLGEEYAVSPVQSVNKPV